MSFELKKATNSHLMALTFIFILKICIKSRYTLPDKNSSSQDVKIAHLLLSSQGEKSHKFPIAKEGHICLVSYVVFIIVAP